MTHNSSPFSILALTPALPPRLFPWLCLLLLSSAQLIGLSHTGGPAVSPSWQQQSQLWASVLAALWILELSSPRQLKAQVHMPPANWPLFLATLSKMSHPSSYWELINTNPPTSHPFPLLYFSPYQYLRSKIFYLFIAALPQPNENFMRIGIIVYCDV